MTVICALTLGQDRVHDSREVFVETKILTIFAQSHIL